ncbi:hypothetical protein SK128_004021 [Halocaridina rubra]|uniref:Uncharacterized protein n=1 Tax=Halocaridina rubra TaxID=373956 RepID=A0AAN8ZZH0_HALRR
MSTTGLFLVIAFRGSGEEIKYEPSLFAALSLCLMRSPFRTRLLEATCLSSAPRFMTFLALNPLPLSGLWTGQRLTWRNTTM